MNEYNFRNKGDIIRWMIVEHGDSVMQVAIKLGMSERQVIRRVLKEEEKSDANGK